MCIEVLLGIQRNINIQFISEPDRKIQSKSKLLSLIADETLFLEKTLERTNQCKNEVVMGWNGFVLQTSVLINFKKEQVIAHGVVRDNVLRGRRKKEEEGGR